MAAQPGYPKETVVAEKLEALTALVSSTTE